jgi:hypothetical protein
MRYLLTTFGFAFLFAAPAFSAENSLLARITTYWPGEGQVRACSNGERLRAGHCAVDPKRIPFGSQVVFPDAACLAVDSGPAVVSRKAARITGRSAAQRNAIVVDRFFESREAALAWERSHPHFMTVRVVPPDSPEEFAAAAQPVAEMETMRASAKITVPHIAKPNITNSGRIKLNPAAAAKPLVPRINLRTAKTTTTNSVTAGPIGTIVRNPLGRTGR